MKRISIVSICQRILLFLWALTIILPIVWIASVSLKTNREFYQSVWDMPSIVQWQNYAKAWQQLSLGQAYLNTLYYVGVSMVITLVLTICISYTLTRIRFRGRGLVRGAILLSLFLPTINALVPTYVLMRNIKLLNSLSGLIILSSFGVNAFNYMVLSSFMKTIPKEMEESATIDGAGYFTTLFRVIAPMAIPGIVTIAVFIFLGLYNNFLWPFIMLGDSSKFPIAVKMYEAQKLMMFDSNWVVLCASIVIGIVPSLLFYVVFQKQVKEGVSVGALKG